MRRCLGRRSSNSRSRVLQGEAGIQNVFDDEDGSAFNADVEVLDQFHFASGIRALAIAGDGDEIERNFSAKFLREVGKKKYRAFQDTDQMQRVIGKIAPDFEGHLLDALFDTGMGDQDVNGFAGAVTGFFLRCAFYFFWARQALLSL